MLHLLSVCLHQPWKEPSRPIC